VTKDGLDPLLPESENTAAIVQPPTEEEMNSAITRTVGNLLAVVSLHTHIVFGRDLTSYV
jgi:[calcium/calmodulin-dependent protein kinase] kinase